MRPFKYIYFIILFFACNGWSGAVYDELIKGLPKDVINVIDRIIGCNYWSSESLGEKNENIDEDAISGRSHAIEKNQSKLKCTKLEKDVRKIRVKYKKKRKIIDAVNDASTMLPSD